MPIGYISYINNKRHYGLINCPELQLDDIFFHFTNCNESYKYIFNGDKILFDIVKTGDKEEVQNIKFIQNASLDGLKKDFEKQTKLKGFLKKDDESYYVKDRETNYYIRLSISINEINLKENYEDKLNQLIDYKIDLFTAKNKIRAVNLNRTFLSECYTILEKSSIEGRVIGKVKDGYKIIVYDKIIGFIPNSLALKGKTMLETEQRINVTCIKAKEDFTNFVFDLSENYELEKERSIKYLPIQIGDSILGKIKSITSYGVFISLGLIEGLLHISNIVYDFNEDSLDIKNKKCNKLLSEIFVAGNEIQVIVESIENGKCSFEIDKTNELNNSYLLD